ncbi:GAF domain-containing sensor histidine kinase [Nodosilinea sp. LEGE 07298]|uniref:GAF domain-containing sensor histidine kinase n=1 Tax=Nodosilinea sp. LEGE 07298 TaxID=2777970 RepID=UPI00187E1382|nr:GAF domain-containing sensor histidine kinase [Nodosilinea sp. LEGE 07298]MBE9111028.1 GAF domain-containing sensor histidine kinase [Nodosilinea sp. LEGE 07298]
MIGSSSSEFIALCQSQVLLLTQALGAMSTVVYLVETTADSMSPTLVPLVAYPETADLWSGLRKGLAAVSSKENDLSSSGQTSSQIAIQLENWPPRPGAADPEPSAYASNANEQRDELPKDKVVSLPSGLASQGLQAEAAAYPLVLPLAHEGVVLGMMVSTRDAQPWTPDDYQQAEQVASTLAIACVMDQRSQWLQRQLNQRQLNQSDQSETFHDLLHQFRNPLTALQTFGKLMVKRLPPEDTNRPIAEGIVRESRRLQDLAQHFDDAVATADETLAQPTSPSVGGLLLPSSTVDLAEHAAATNDEEGAASLLAIAPSPGLGLGRSLTVKPGAIADVALPLVQSIRPLAQERGLHLVHHIPSSLPDVWLDSAALSEVLHNLIDNALKYASPGSLVWVTAGLVQRLNTQIFQGIAVGDTGEGIPPGDQPQLFTRHFRGVQAQGNIPGTGLGLAIVQDLVQGMGGHIDLISPVGTPWLPPEAAAYPPSPGTLFVVWLQVSPEASPLALGTKADA